MTTFTKTHEPLRPLRAPDDGSPFYYYGVFGDRRVDYGSSDWPSRSYWLPPGGCPDDREYVLSYARAEG